jgi:hypothetical protein
MRAWSLASMALLTVVSGCTTPHASVGEMVQSADYPLYVFDEDPPWTGQRRITGSLDLASPPHRMFRITYRAPDGRHVVLVQSRTYNRMLGEKVRAGDLVYTSPGGVRVWSGPRGPWLAGILLRSSQADLGVPPGPELTGYALETPDGTFPCLAINGRVTDSELHTLIDSLVPAEAR